VFCADTARDLEKPGSAVIIPWVGDAAAPAADTTSELIGRQNELDYVERFVGDVRTGTHGLVVFGEPGIGKTALWRHAIARCREAGCQLLITRPSEEEMPLSGCGLVDLLEESAVDLDRLRAEEDPLECGRTVLEALRRLAASGPTVVAIDDLQWLDSVSARALRYALRRADREPLGVLGTARSAQPDPLGIRETLPPGRSETVELGPLSLGALRRLLSGTVSAISRPALAQIHSLSGGNPLYALELARAMPDGRRSTDIALPGSLRTALEHRLDALPARLEPVLEAVSALGATSVQSLRNLLPESDVDAILEAAIAEQVLALDEDLSVRFAHPLLGSVVYTSLSPLARRSLHARLAAQATEPDVRARHLALSTDDPDESIASLLERAATRAAGRGANDLASEFAGHGRRLTPVADEASVRRRALAEIEYLAAAGEVRQALSRADRLVRSLAPGPERVEALVQRAELEDDDRDTAEALLLGALDEAGTDERLRGRVFHRLAQLRRLRAGDLPGAIDAARSSLALAEDCGDPTLELHAAAYLGHLEALGGKPRPDLMDRAVRLEAELGVQPLSIRPRSLLAMHRLWAGDLPAARALLDAVQAEAARAGNEMKQPQHFYISALVENASGNLELAHTLAARGLEAALDAENTYAERELLYPLARAEAWLGREQEARATAQRLCEEASTHGVKPLLVRAASVLGLLALSLDDLESACDELARAADLLERMGFANPGAFRVLPDAIEALARSEELSAAEALHERLESEAAAAGPWSHAAVERARGALLLARGDAERAADVLDGAAACFQSLEHGPDTARALLLRAQALLRAGRRSLAAEVAAAAHARFSAMGATLWEARALELLERLQPGRAAGRLTAAETRVAALVAKGMKNREIGQALFMSVATVEAHLTRIYRKLDIRSRTELARLVADSALVLDEQP
jgi:DNA-binding NarL/FixJ family response regulator